MALKNTKHQALATKPGTTELTSLQQAVADILNCRKLVTVAVSVS